REKETPETKGEVSRLELLPDQCVYMIDPAKQQWNQERVQSDEDLHQPINTQRLPDPLCKFSGQRTAECEAAHKRGKHGADRERRSPKDQSQHPRPEHFINEPRRPRENET